MVGNAVLSIAELVLLILAGKNFNLHYYNYLNQLIAESETPEAAVKKAGTSGKNVVIALIVLCLASGALCGISYGIMYSVIMGSDYSYDEDYSIGSESDDSAIIMDSCLTQYSDDNTVGEVFENFFADTSWVAYDESGSEYVMFDGTCTSASTGEDMYVTIIFGYDYGH